MHVHEEHADKSVALHEFDHPTHHAVVQAGGALGLFHNFPELLVFLASSGVGIAQRIRRDLTQSCAQTPQNRREVHLPVSGPERNRDILTIVAQNKCGLFEPDVVGLRCKQPGNTSVIENKGDACGASNCACKTACNVYARRTESKFKLSKSSAATHTFMMCGNRNKIPECMPVPRPTEDKTPNPTHQVT